MPVTPVLSVPAVAWPQAISHAAVVDMVTAFYRDHPDASTSKEWRRRVDKGLALGANAGAAEHPLALAPEVVVKSRDFPTRNAEARTAFRQWGVDAARAALQQTGVPTIGIDAVLVANCTCVAMPGLAHDLIDALNLRRDVEVLTGGMVGCLGGAYAISAAATYVRAHPGRRVLIVTADFASPHLHLETELTGADLIGAVLSACLFSDGAAAAVMSADCDASGFAIHGGRSHTLPGTQDAVAWEVTRDGLAFRLGSAPSLIPQVAPSMRQTLSDQYWTPADLSVCALHTGGPRVIDAARDELGLSEHHVAPTREAMRRGNTMSVAVMDALHLIGTDARFRPAPGARGIGAGFGPGFSAISFAWTYEP